MSPRPIDRLKPYFKSRPRSPSPPQSGGRPAAAGPATPTPAAVPAPGKTDLEQRRERLARDFAELQSDLGGLVYEMAIRDHYRLDVVTRQAARLQAVDLELTKVERMLSPAVPAPVLPAPVVYGVCLACGTPAQPRATFCGHCGAPLARSIAPPSMPGAVAP